MKIPRSLQGWPAYWTSTRTPATPRTTCSASGLSQRLASSAGGAASTAAAAASACGPVSRSLCSSRDSRVVPADRHLVRAAVTHVNAGTVVRRRTAVVVDALDGADRRQHVAGVVRRAGDHLDPDPAPLDRADPGVDRVRRAVTDLLGLGRDALAALALCGEAQAVALGGSAAPDRRHHSLGPLDHVRRRCRRVVEAPRREAAVAPGARHVDRDVVPALDAEAAGQARVSGRVAAGGAGGVGAVGVAGEAGARRVPVAQRQRTHGHRHGDRHCRGHDAERRTPSPSRPPPGEVGEPLGSRCVLGAGRERVTQPRLEVAHDPSCLSPGVSPRSARRAASPRETRERAVPSATPVSAAISAYSSCS